MQQDFDLIVVGGGIIGAALALAMDRHNWRVALIERSKSPPEWKAHEQSVKSYDLRVNTLNPVALELLESLQVLPPEVDPYCTPFYNMSVWDAEGSGHIEFSAAELRLQQLGKTVENKLLIHHLWQQIQGDSCNISVFTEHSPTVLEWHNPRQASLQLQGDEQLTTRCLVGADGRDSQVRKLMGAKLQRWDMRQNALVTTVEMEFQHRYTAWQRFLGSGPVAMLPLNSGGQNLCSIVWSLDQARAEEIMSMSDIEFSKAFEQATESRLGRVVDMAERRDFQLQQSLAVPFVKGPVALAGDALRSIHPLAGQGVNLGLLDVSVLVEQFVQYGFDSIEMALKAYRRKRSLPSWRMLGTMAGFKTLFGSERSDLRWLRNAGLDLVREFKPLKKTLMREALGLRNS